ncbi:phosphoribosylglycinamide formyltransferase [soil metagenome]
MTDRKILIAIFASGAGSNAKKIIEYFKDSLKATIALIVCNKPGAGAINIAQQHHIPVLLIERKKFIDDGYLNELHNHKIDLIVLAGFLWKVPPAIIQTYKGNIINIHPALLPAYGGKGMYGNFVHEAILAAKEKESGITIHFVDDLYDHGAHILQVRCPVYENDTPATLAQRIHELEHNYFPKAIEKVIDDNFFNTRS